MMLPVDTIYTLRDLDNRGDDDQPFEMRGDLVEIVTYLDGPLRSDLTDPEINGADVDAAIDRLADDQIEEANVILNRMCVYVALADVEVGGHS